MRGKWRWILVFLIVIIIGLVVSPFLIDVNRFRPLLESKLSASLGREVKVGHLRLSILSGGLKAENLSIAEDPSFGSSPFVSAQSFSVGVEMIPLLFSRALHITNVRLDKPEISLLQNSSGRWNFSSLAARQEKKPAGVAGDSSGSMSVNIAKLEITNGRIVMGTTNAAKKPQVYDQVNLRSQNLSLSSEFPITLSAILPGEGTLKADGKVGPLNGVDASRTPFQINLAVQHFDLTTSRALDPASALQGLVNLEGTFNSDGRQVRGNGQAKTDRLLLVKGGAVSRQPVLLEFGFDHDLSRHGGILRKGSVRIGQALALLSGTYEMHPESTTANMKFQGRDMPVNDLESFLPAIGILLPAGSQLKGGTLTLDFGLRGPLDKLTMTGAAILANSQLAGFDLGSKISVLSKLVNSQSKPDTSIQNLSSQLQIAPEGIRAENINLVVPALGKVAGNGTITPANVLDFKMNAILTGASLLSNVSKLGGFKQTGEVSIPFFIKGTTAKPEFVPDTKGIAASTVKSTIGNDAIQSLTNLFGKKKK